MGEKNEWVAHRVWYLADQILDMSVRGFDINRLGSVALEILVTRNQMEELLTGDYLEEEKREVRKMLAYVKDLEKGVIRLYVLMLLGKEAIEREWRDRVLRKYLR